MEALEVEKRLARLRIIHEGGAAEREAEENARIDQRLKDRPDLEKPGEHSPHAVSKVHWQ
jgi:hypothetical protein